MDTLKKLGMYLTCDPVYEEEDRKYHKKVIHSIAKGTLPTGRVPFVIVPEKDGMYCSQTFAAP